MDLIAVEHEMAQLDAAYRPIARNPVDAAAADDPAARGSALKAALDRLGVDTAPILEEIAAMSSDEDRYGMGSMRSVILAYFGQGHP